MVFLLNFQLYSDVLIESDDNDTSYKISTNGSNETVGEVFDWQLQAYKQVPIRGNLDLLTSKSMVIPFQNCIEYRRLLTESGEIAQFNESRALDVKEVEDMESLQVDHVKDHTIDVSAGGIFFPRNHTLFLPISNEEIIKIIHLARKYKRKVRVIGATHSLNPICHTNDYIVSLKKMNRVLNVDLDSCTFEGGIMIRALCEELEKYGLTLPVLGSICEQMFVGAISTGTRGQVPSQGSLASLVTHLELIDGMGNLRSFSLDSNKKELHAVVTSMGLMGIVTKVTIKCSPLFLMSEIIRRVELEKVFSQLEELNQNEKLVMFWNVKGNEVKVITGHRVDCHLDPSSLANFQTLGACPHLHSMENFPDTLQRIGKSWDIISFVRWSEEKSRVKAKKMMDEGLGVLQGDYSIPREQFIPLIKEIKKFFEENSGGFALACDRMVIEMRPVKSDDVWLSPSYGRDSYSLCFHDFERNLKWPLMGQESLSLLEELLKKYGARPHLGKAHFFNNVDLNKAFPKWKDFKELRVQFDPENIFLTDYLFQMFSDKDRTF